MTALTLSGSSSGKGDASDEDDENEFFDAMEDPAEYITVPADPKYHRSAPLRVSPSPPRSPTQLTSHSGSSSQKVRQ